MTTSGSIEGSAPGARSDLLLPLGVVGLLAVLIVPLPTFLLDCLIALNMSLAVLTLLVVLAARDPMEFSTFPSLLLFTTLLRLALNVASTRLILLNSDAGAVIQSFGDFVVGGDLIVGAVIFIILVVIQFVVITKGAGRISEVAARFTLDAMPGKQMAIDADLNAGLISSEDARERREEVSREAEFYGAMDGAQKFVRGDALAGIIITGVNLLGGMAIALSRGTSLGEAAQTYSLLTVGDGLVSQIPALVIATSGGIIVTKAANDRRLGFEMSTQFITNPQTLAMGSLLVLGAALVPGLPAAPFLVLSAVLFGFFRVAKGARDEADRQALKQEEAVSTDAGPESEVQEIVDLLKVDRLSIEIGYRLIHLVEEGGLLDHIAMSRKRFATELGIVIPPVRVKDNLELEPSAYRFYVQGEMIASGEIRSGCFLAMDPGTATGKLEGVKTKEPTFGLPAKWIPQDKKDEAELLGYTVVDGVALMITHFTECVRQYAHDILNRDDVKMLVDQVKESSPTLIEELVPDVVSLGDVQRVLRALLRERVPVRDLSTILETIAEIAPASKETEALKEACRGRLARSLVQRFQEADGTLYVVTLDPEMERAFGEQAKAQGNPEGSGSIRRMMEAIGEALSGAAAQGHEAAVLCRGDIRHYLSELVRVSFPRVGVVSFQEATTADRVESLGVARVSHAN